MTETTQSQVLSGASLMHPTIVFFNGRGGTGKTTLARLHAEWAIQQEIDFRILDLDRTNATFSAFFPERTDRPPSADDNDVMDFLQKAINEQTAKRHHLIVDFGGGDLILKALAKRARLVRLFESYGIRPVMVHHFGADPDYLSFMKYFEDGELLAPEATILVLNAHVKPQRLSVTAAFEQTIKPHEIFRAAISRGAKFVVLPDLPCAHHIDRHRLMFYEAYAGQDGIETGRPPALSPFDRAELGIWLEDLENQFAEFSDWLPWLPAPEGLLL
ncbi:AAA family ATPase [Gluconobacter cerinus]|uniref:AAA family ATPase n=1 Tax=Gluconobacter TaxID=441 RepID=UPI001B8CC4DE|nr:MULTISPECIES: AAA family ATPase [Gluconobacter]MBS0995806.1 AAA family ATPase [Gluconobacter cerinus]MBS1022124.1 AAA family ATPase [Gluconobacter cerinus]